jgi:hypothetical protein
MLKIKWREAIQIKDEKERVFVQSHTKTKHLKEEYFRSTSVSMVKKKSPEIAQ